MKPIVYHIPVCPFSQRVEIQLELKGRRQDVDFVVVDITQPRPDWRSRPWPPRNKNEHAANDGELGL